ncbi:hypothetical protein HKW98_09140 [Stutzerimonas urumqiensis]|uniref:hypothetical protein n=1 Tax=Stutzerimonas urumqiensis TaxID=638269 RepID=UPI003BA8CAE5
MQAHTPEVSAAKATTPSAGLRLVSVEQLKKIHRDLDACQKVIWLAGCRPRGYGFDPAYVTDAQARLAEIEALLAQQEPAPAQTEQPAITLSVPQKPGTYLLATGYVGNALLFWRRGGRGYTTNVAEAEVYDEALAVRMFGARAFEDVPWPVEALSTGYRVVTGPEYMDQDAVRRSCEQQAVWRAGISKGDVK